MGGLDDYEGQGKELQILPVVVPRVHGSSTAAPGGDGCCFALDWRGKGLESVRDNHGRLARLWGVGGLAFQELGGSALVPSGGGGGGVAWPRLARDDPMHSSKVYRKHAPGSGAKAAGADEPCEGINFPGRRAEESRRRHRRHQPPRGATLPPPPAQSPGLLRRQPSLEACALHRPLTFVDLSGNALSGCVPGWLLALPHLEVLRLDRNRLSRFPPLQPHHHHHHHHQLQRSASHVGLRPW